jgi:uncharacterized protein YqeY
MSLREQLSLDLKEAMRHRDERRKLAIRAVRAAITNAEVERRRPLTEDEILALIVKEVKQRQESMAQFRQGGREDLVAQEEAELRVLEGYLPRPLSDEELRAEARRVMGEVGATGLRDMGKVMGPLMAVVRGRADGGQVSQIVRELLSG